MQTVIVFQNKSLADTILKEIAATPAIEGGTGAVWCWYDPDSDANAVQYAQSADGRCAVAHHWSEIDRDWLEAYLAEWTAVGTVQILDALPADWQYPTS
jgi:hypothetical protein